ncbi:hypothetical protein PL75_07265 [Neisseria arctica]|uniref:Uncharacterized protein n=1 Tax=Neisseria arctica TaxID=1470200 RepID=A0A0J1C2Y1_9NEIS|nr:hypothetical protein PL75_07265 [Neisseria arctica]
MQEPLTKVLYLQICTLYAPGPSEANRCHFPSRSKTAKDSTAVIVILLYTTENQPTYIIRQIPKQTYAGAVFTGNKNDG